MRLKRIYRTAACALAAMALYGVIAQPARAQQDVITTAIGGGPNGIPAIQSDLNDPVGVALDGAGNYYVTVCAANRLYKVGASGTLTVVAGTGQTGYGGDGVTGGAANALLSCPVGVVVDSAGNIYISEYNNDVIRKIDTTKTITTIAGVSGQCNYNGDGAPATSFHLCHPQGLALDRSGNLYIADTTNSRIRELALSSDTISTYAGTGTAGYAGDGGPAISAKLNSPIGLAIDNAADIFIADTSNFRIREVSSTTGTITTIAGTGTNGFTGDGGPAIAANISNVYNAIGVNGAGTTVTIGDALNNERIRQFTVGGNIATVAGTGSASYCGDSGAPTSACIHYPYGLAVSGAGSIYVADRDNQRIREFTVGGTINTVAGNGNITFPTLVSGVPASGVVLNGPTDLLVDPSGNVFITEYNNCMVRELVKATGMVNIFAGSAASGATTGTCGFSGEGGPATSAQLGELGGIARDKAGNMYIADQTNCTVWEVAAATGTISLFAGVTPRSCGYAGDGGAATSAKLNAPNGLFVDSRNNVYIADSSNNRVREVSGGIINTIAGDGTAGYLGDGDPATTARLNYPGDAVLDSAGDVFITDYNNCVIREVTAATGIISTAAGTGACGFNGDGLATEHELNRPARLHVDANDNLFIAENNNQRVRWLSAAGFLTTIGGNGSAGFSGDTGPALNAEFSTPQSVTQDAAGNYLIADYSNLRIRGITAFPALNVSPASVDFELTTVGTTSTPAVLTLSALGSVTFSNISISGPFTEYDDCGTALSNAATCVMYVFFKPTAAGTEAGMISIEDNGFFSNTTTINLEGTGNAIAVTGGPLLFGNQAVKTTSAAKKVTVTNKGTVAITMGTMALNETDFSIGGNTCPASGAALAAGASCTVSIVFKPKSTGVKKGALIVNDSDPSSPQIVGLSGTGTSLVVFNPSSVTFGSQAVGTTSALTKVTLTNNTAATLTLNSPALTISGPFSSAKATTCTNGLPIAAGGTCVIYLQFTPTTVGFPTGTLSVADSDSTSPQTVPLSGTATGVEFTPNPVTLSSTVGHQVSTSVTIANMGTSTIAFTAWTITGPNNKDFTTSLGDPPCSGSLAPGGLCTFTAYFTPSLVGSESASLLVYDNNTGSPQALPLSGTGQ